MKTLNKFFPSFLLTLCLCASVAKANDQMQTDTNTLAAFSTNTFKLSGDVTGSFTNGQQTGNSPYIVCVKGADVWLECGGFFTNNGAGPSNITFRIAGSVSGTVWTNNYQSVVLSVPVGTNYAAASLWVQHPPPFVGLRAIENINTANVSGRTGAGFLKAYVKDGI